MNKKLNLSEPVSFTEKIQWLKLYDYHPSYTGMVDKISAKKYVASKIGEKYVIPTIGIWNKPEEIDFEVLPQQFVLKTSHSGGTTGVVICKDKNNFNLKSAKRILYKSLHKNISASLIEKPYKKVPKKILAEKYILPYSGKELVDYKIFCFNGEPKFLKVDFGRFKKHHANYYNLNWELLPYGESGLEPDYSHVEEKPKNFDEMISIARVLSYDFRFIRVDLYNVEGRIYFGELTFYPASGLLPWTDQAHDVEIGEMLKL